MGYKNIAFLSVLAGIGGIGWYGYFNEWIIIRNPWKDPSHRILSPHQVSKKKIQLCFWHQDRWHGEYNTLRLTESIQEQALTILQAWFHEAVQSGFIIPCALEAALYDARISCLYLSCTTSPLAIQKSTYDNLIIIESLLKTIRENIPHRIQSVQLMVNHTPLEHPFIICTKPIPISGFGILSS